MKKLIENPVDCFGWKAEFGNFIEGSGEAPRFEIELYGFYKEGSEIDPGKLSNILRLIEDRMNGKESELETTLKRRMSNFMYGAYSNHVNCKGFIIPEIKNVIFNPPATIVFWIDGTKTVVKCQNDEEFDPEKGITMAFFKKMHGNKGHYFEEIKKWCEPYHKDDDSCQSN